eukprot:scaffold33570_cov126-Skeletonema_dohrnii-CCMP3373.AAC.6
MAICNKLGATWMDVASKIPLDVTWKKERRQRSAIRSFSVHHHFVLLVPSSVGVRRPDSNKKDNVSETSIRSLWIPPTMLDITTTF